MQSDGRTLTDGQATPLRVFHRICLCGMFWVLPAIAGCTEQPQARPLAEAPLKVEDIMMPEINMSPAPGGDVVWRDEFDGYLLNMNKWSYRGLGRRHDAYNVPDTVRLDGLGRLEIVTRSEGDRILTGMIGTQDKFERTYGYFEARVKFQKQPGHWSMFWLQSERMGKFIGDPARGGAEIDVFEYMPNTPDMITQGLRWNGYVDSRKSALNVARIQPAMEWHVIGMDWTPREYVFYVDGQETWRTSQAVSQIPQYIVLSLEVGGWAGELSEEKLPDSVLFDYVRVYKTRPIQPRP